MASSSRAMISLLGKFPHYLAKTIKQNHPVSWTGILLHTMRWLEARSSQLILPNPGFNPQAGKSVAIYCVHGTADRELSFLTMANQLIKLKLPECIKHIVLVNFKNRATGAGIEEDYQEQLLQQILANGDDHVVVMGHSRGGIIASSFAEFCAAKNNIKVEMVVPICAPFGGSYLALDVLAYFSKSVEEMQIGSEFLERLKKAVEQSDYRYYFLRPVVIG